MALGDIARVRIILDLIQNGDVTTEANYGNGIDKIALPIAAKYADAFLYAYPKTWYDNATPPQPRLPTNDEKAEYFIKRIKIWLKEIRVNHIRNTDEATKTAQDAALTTAESETSTELGV